MGPIDRAGLMYCCGIADDLISSCLDDRAVITAGLDWTNRVGCFNRRREDQ